MDELVKIAIETTREKQRSSVPWKFDEPWRQPHHIYDQGEYRWQKMNPTAATAQPSTPDSKTSKLALYSWNIDFMLPFPDSRMRAAVRHLESLTQKLPDSTASVIFLQECVESDLRLLAADAWVQRSFVITDTGIENWQSGHYGTVTLIDRRLPITSCFRVHYSQTRMERDGLFVDLLVGKSNKPLRLCNTHLESLALEPAMRPPQVEMVAKYMRDAEVLGSLVAGDFNAIQEFDRTLHSENGLKDAYLERGGSEDDAEGGHTWGQQAATAQRNRFGTSRMDKVFFCGDLRCVGFDRFGAGVLVADPEEQERIVELGFDQPWITDHLGVKTIFEIGEQPAGRGSSL